MRKSTKVEPQTLAEALRARREELGHTQTEAEAEMDLSMGHVSRWESRRLPAPGQPDVVAALRLYLGLEEEEFSLLFLRSYCLGLPK